MDRYLKFVIYVVTAVVGSTGAALFNGQGLTGQEFANVAVLAGTAAFVFLKANTPSQPWAKAAVAIGGAAMAVVVSSWTDRAISAEEISQIVLAVLGALSVATVANVPPGVQPEATTVTSAGATTYLAPGQD